MVVRLLKFLEVSKEVAEIVLDDSKSTIVSFFFEVNTGGGVLHQCSINVVFAAFRQSNIL